MEIKFRMVRDGHHYAKLQGVPGHAVNLCLLELQGYFDDVEFSRRPTLHVSTVPVADAYGVTKNRDSATGVWLNLYRDRGGKVAGTEVVVGAKRLADFLPETFWVWMEVDA